MARLVLLLFFIISVNVMLSESTDIHCNYRVRDWQIVKNSYHCSVNQDPQITSRESATISSMSTNHQSGKTNLDIDAFHVESKTVHYFPQDLEKFFKTLLVIDINRSNLKEVHQVDLKNFPKLIQIFLYANALEVLEEGLFDFNPNLEFINLHANKIVHIEPKVFDNLGKLSTLRVKSNTCIDKETENSISEVKNVIQAAKSQCINSDFSNFKAKLENLEKDSKILLYEDFKVKMTNWKNYYKPSKFITFRPLNYKYEALMNTKFENVMLERTSVMDEKLESMANSMTKVSTDLTSSHLNLATIKEVKATIDKFGSTLSALKAGQSSLSRSINNVCTKASLTQLMDELKVQNADDKFKSFGDEIKGQLKDVKGQLADFKAEMIGKLARNEKELANTRHKITVAIDEKIRGSEKRLMKKFEEILEEKLGKFTLNSRT